MKETKFKDTEIGKIPEDWEVTPIGKACNVRRGVRVTKEQLTDEGRYPVYQNTNYPMGRVFKILIILMSNLSPKYPPN